MTDLPPRGGGPSRSERGLAPLYWPGVGVLGRARFAYKPIHHRDVAVQ